MKICPKCATEHEKPGGFCSRSCANSRGPRTEDFKQKVKLKLEKNYDKICNFCGTSFVAKRKSAKYCGQDCGAANARKHINYDNPSRSSNLSDALKESYKNGKKVYGGRTLWHNYKELRVQGTYELRTCRILDTWADLNQIRHWEYTNDRFAYTNSDGEEATYLLDFKVYQNDGSIYYIETKGFIRENDELKWDAVKALGHELKVWFLEDIEYAENKL